MAVLAPLVVLVCASCVPSGLRPNSKVTSLPAAAQPTPAANLVPTLTPTPFKPQPPSTATRSATQPFRLTHGGCCVDPAWSPDSDSLVVLAKPATADVSGLYRVLLNGQAMKLIVSRPGVLSPSQSLVAYVESGQVYVQDLAAGTRWAIPSAGHMVRFSPDGSLVAWEVVSSGVTNLDRRRWELWVASPDGKNPHKVVSGIGGGFIGWTPDEAGWVFSGRLTEGGDSGVWVKDSIGAPPRLVFPSERIRSPLLSPERGWLALTVAFSANTDQDGLWLVPISSPGTAEKLPIYGSYRWRSENQLLVIPLETVTKNLPLMEFNATTQTLTRLLGLQSMGIHIANNTWLPSPDGQSLAFLSAEDMSLWLIGLPQVSGGP